MASTISKPVKQLAELLQEQQEPFVLEVYLLERGHLRKTKSSKTLKRSASWGMNKTKKGALSCSKILRSVYNKFVSRRNNNGSSSVSCEHKDGNFNAKREEIGEPERFSSASSRTQYESCSEGDAKDEFVAVSLPNDHKSCITNVITERKIELLKGGSSKSHFKQHNPLPAPIDDNSSHANAGQEPHDQSPCSSTRSFIFPKKITEDSALSASLWEVLFLPPLEKQARGTGVSENLEPVMGSKHPSPHFTQSKRVLQQTRQLLFDCVREMTETHAKQEKEKQQQSSYQRYFGAQEIGKLIYEKLGTWEKQPGDEGNINILLEFDWLGSADEWYNNYQEKRETGSEIGDAILEEMIKEIVAEK